MFRKIFVSIKKNKLIIAAFTALISFSLFHINIDFSIDSLLKVIILPANKVSSDVLVPSDNSSNEAVELYKSYEDKLTRKVPMKSYTLTLQKPMTLTIKMSGIKVTGANVSAYELKVVNSENKRVIYEKVKGTQTEFEFARPVHFEAGTYRIKISLGSFYKEGTYKLQITTP